MSTNWGPYFGTDPLERNTPSQRNYYPYNRTSPHVDPNFHNATYHTNAMPYFGAKVNGNGQIVPPAMSAYKTWAFPMCAMSSWEQ